MIPSQFEGLFRVQVRPAEIAARVEIDLHYDCKDCDHDAWLCRVFDKDGKHVSADTGDTAALAMTNAMKPFDRLPEKGEAGVEHVVVVDGTTFRVPAGKTEFIVHF